MVSPALVFIIKIVISVYTVLDGVLHGRVNGLFFLVSVYSGLSIFLMFFLLLILIQEKFSIMVFCFAMENIKL